MKIKKNHFLYFLYKEAIFLSLFLINVSCYSSNIFLAPVSSLSSSSAAADEEDTPSDILALIRKIIDNVYIQFYLRVGFAQQVPDTSTILLRESREVRYGKFELSFDEIFPVLVNFAVIIDGKRVFDFGSGDGRTAFKIASYGAVVDGMEVEEFLYSLSAAVRTWLANAAAKQSNGLLSGGVRSKISELLERISFKQGDIFHSDINFKNYDVVYLYYPEPHVNESDYLRSLSLKMTDPLKGLRNDAVLVVLRQGSNNSIPVKGMKCIDSRIVDIRSSKYVKQCTLSKYRIIINAEPCPSPVSFSV
jgi:hypothetical protein